MKKPSPLLFLSTALLTLCFSVSLFAQNKPPEKKTAEAKPAADAKAPAPIAVDAELSEVIDDLRIINAEIARIERAQGAVEIPNSIANLRLRAEIKKAHMQKWLDDHHVGKDWVLNEQGQFVPPPLKPEAKEAKPEGKK